MGPELLESPQVGGTSLTTFAPCSLHRAHAPKPNYCEEHHVIPRAWQASWRPGDSPELLRPEVDSLALLSGETKPWDPRTVAICRTGHGNVHFWLVRFMREWYEIDKTTGVGANPVAQLTAAVVRVRRRAHEQGFPFGRKETETARLGMERWLNAGGSLRALCNRGLFGEI